MSRIDEMIQELKTKRDEIAVQVHLGSKELQEEFRELEGKWEHFRAQAGLDRTAKDIGAALETLGGELKRGYERLKKAL